MKLASVAFVIGVSLNAPQSQTSPPTFIFQNNFWLNLHQFLRGEIFRRGANRPLGIDPASLTEPERAAWTSAIDAYRDGR